MRGPLALSPKEFAGAGSVVPYPAMTSNQPYAMTNHIPTLPYPQQAGLWLAILGCHDGDVEHPLVILIQLVNSRITENRQTIQYVRFIRPPASIPVTAEMLGNADMKTIYLQKNIVIARTHDKEYTYRLRMLKPVDRHWTPSRSNSLWPISLKTGQKARIVA